MNRLFPIMIIVFIAIACSSKKDRAVANFNSIDLTYGDGWHCHHSFHVDTLGNLLINEKCSSRPEKYFKVYFQDSIFNKMVSLIDRIEKTNFDTSYVDDNCADCGFYKIVVNFKQKKISTWVYGGDNYRNETNTLDSLVRILCNPLNQKMKLLPIDTTFNFESDKNFGRPFLKSEHDTTTSIEKK